MLGKVGRCATKNGACANYVKVSKFQWKPSWLATQQDPQKCLDCHPKSCELWRIRTGPFQWRPFWLATQRDPQKWLDCQPKSCELWRFRTGPISVEATLSCHPVRSTEWLDWEAKWYSGFHLLCSFFVWKNKIARLSDSLQIFRRALLWSHLFPTVWMRSLARKIMGFWAPGSLCHAFSVGSSGKLRIKSIHKGREGPVEDCC